MKMKTLFSILILSALSLTSCNNEVAKTTNNPSSNDGGTDGGGSGGGGTNGGGGGTGGDGSNSEGTFPIRSYNILVAGEGTGIGGNYKPENTWKPWGNSDSISETGQSLLPKIVEAKNFFESDSKLDIRFKLLPPPNPPAGVEYCYGRTTGQAGDANEYTKAKFKVSLRDVSCQSGGDSNDCQLGHRYQTRTVGPISVNSRSPVLQMGHLRNVSAQGTVVEVHDVFTDHNCQYNGENCEANEYLRTSSCWEALMEFATDYTQSF